MQLKPLFARVLLERPKKQKQGSIIIPEMAQSRHASLKCKVLDKGPTADPSINIGSYVLIGRHAGDWLSAEGNPVPNMDQAEFYICQDEDILCEVTE